MKLNDIINSKKGNQPDDFDIDDVNVEEQIQQLYAQRYDSDTNDRKWLAKWTAFTVSVWLLCVLFVVVFNKILLLNLSDNVLVALLATTTLNVLGLSFIVLRGHFISTKNNYK